MTRRLLSGALRDDPAIEVVAEAADAFTANALIAQHRPDVVTLDVEMPQMDGLAFLRHLMKHHPVPVIIVSSFTPTGSAASIEALRAGAVDVIPKPQNPSAVAPFAGRLRHRVHELRHVSIRLRTVESDASPRQGAAPPSLGRPIHALVAIGASTGGPIALEALLAQLPADMPPIVIVQHMPAHFTGLFARRLNETSAMRVVEAGNRQELAHGVAHVAPGDHHLTIEERDGRLQSVLRRGAPVNHQRPSVDVLFQSLANLRALPVVGVLLTGMGDDGANGMVALSAKGHETIAEDEQSCVVFGMPREAIARGGARHVAPIGRIPGLVVECLGRLARRGMPAADEARRDARQAGRLGDAGT